MMRPLYLPSDEMIGRIGFDRAADFLELSAFFSNDAMVPTSDLVNEMSIGAAEDHADLEDEMENGEEEVVSGTVNRIEARRRALDFAYPFDLDRDGDILRCVLSADSVGHAAYILSLVLSNLRSVSPVLGGSDLHPGDEEVRRLREYFQYFATAALAAEVHGNAWSFGFPRPDNSPFIQKLKEIWREFGDGYVEAQIGAPSMPKDDQIDIFAARLPPDRLPGFLLAAAQVATGKDMRNKSLKGHLGAFKSRWFAKQPVTELIAYMIVPFATEDNQFLDDVRTLGNVLHRLRVPRRAEEAGQLVEAGMTVEGYDRLAEAVQWVADYRSRAGVTV